MTGSVATVSQIARRPLTVIDALPYKLLDLRVMMLLSVTVENGTVRARVALEDGSEVALTIKSGERIGVRRLQQP